MSEINNVGDDAPVLDHHLGKINISTETTEQSPKTDSSVTNNTSTPKSESSSKPPSSSSTNFPYANSTPSGLGFGISPQQLPFQNQPHTNPHRTQDTIVGTEGFPRKKLSGGTELDHLPNCICPCGQYHSVLSDKAKLIRVGYRHILSGGTPQEAIALVNEPSRPQEPSTRPNGANPFLLIMNMNMFLNHWTTTDPDAFGEIVEDDIRRKRLGVAEELIQVELDSAPILCGADRQTAIDAVEEMTQVNQAIAPIIQQKWDEQHAQED